MLLTFGKLDWIDLAFFEDNEKNIAEITNRITD